MKRLNLDVEDELFAEFKAYCASKGSTMREEVIELIRMRLEGEEEESCDESEGDIPTLRPMPKRGKLGDEDADFVVKKDFCDLVGNLNKRLDEFVLIQREHDTATQSRLAQLTNSKTDYCPECGVYTRDLFAHLKKNPETHGLVKTVEVVKEVVKEAPKKSAVKDIPAEHSECEQTNILHSTHLF